MEEDDDVNVNSGDGTDYEKMYVDLLDNMDNLGFSIQLQAKQARAKYLANRNLMRRVEAERKKEEKEEAD